MALHKFCVISASVIGLLVWAEARLAQTAAPGKALDGDPARETLLKAFGMKLSL